MAGTLAEKVWDAHVVRSVDGEPDLLYIDLHLVHEVTSPQAFEGLRMNGREAVTIGVTSEVLGDGRDGFDFSRSLASLRITFKIACTIRTACRRKFKGAARSRAICLGISRAACQCSVVIA